jgi:hypothetical protein
MHQKTKVAPKMAAKIASVNRPLRRRRQPLGNYNPDKNYCGYKNSCFAESVPAAISSYPSLISLLKASELVRLKAL